MDREQRASIHKKQATISVKTGKPTASELTEGIPVFREINGTVYQVIKFKNKLRYFTSTLSI